VDLSEQVLRLRPPVWPMLRALTALLPERLLPLAMAHPADDPDFLAELAALCPDAVPRARAALGRSLSWAEQGTLIAVLPERAALLATRLEAVAAIADPEARWEAFWALVGGLEDSREARRWLLTESLRRYGPEPVRLAHIPDEELTVADEAALAELERARHGATFTAWRCSTQARRAPASARAPLLDRAIREFAALRETPIDPGNDEGPFWAIAELLDSAQVDAALAILDGMHAEAWCYQLAGSRSALATRLAWLGRFAEAEAQLARIHGIDRGRPSGAFAEHWWAEGLGGLLAALLVHGQPLAPLLAEVERAPESTRHRVLDAFCHRCQRAEQEPLPPEGGIPIPDPAAAAEVALALAGGLTTPRSRRLALDQCIATWAGVLPMARWLALIAALEDVEQASLLVTLAESEPADVVLEALLGMPLEGDLSERLTLLSEHHRRLQPQRLRPLWEAWLERQEEGAALTWALSWVTEDWPRVWAWVWGREALVALAQALAATPGSPPPGAPR
jgi:hypothetical protein